MKANVELAFFPYDSVPRARNALVVSSQVSFQASSWPALSSSSFQMHISSLTAHKFSSLSLELSGIKGIKLAVLMLMAKILGQLESRIFWVVISTALKFRLALARPSCRRTEQSWAGHLRTNEDCEQDGPQRTSCS